MSEMFVGETSVESTAVISSNIDIITHIHISVFLTFKTETVYHTHLDFFTLQNKDYK